MDFEEGLRRAPIVWTPEEVLDNFIEAIMFPFQDLRLPIQG